MSGFDLAPDGTYLVVVSSLTKAEWGAKGYKSGGHIFLIDRAGKQILDLKTPGDGLGCSISPDSNFWGVITMGPEWGVYYFNRKGKLLWNKKFDKNIGGIELTNKGVIIFDKLHKETRKKLFELDSKGHTKHV